MSIMEPNDLNLKNNTSHTTVIIPLLKLHRVLWLYIVSSECKTNTTKLLQKNLLARLDKKHHLWKLKHFYINIYGSLKLWGNQARNFFFLLYAHETPLVQGRRELDLKLAILGTIYEQDWTPYEIIGLGLGIIDFRSTLNWPD